MKTLATSEQLKKAGYDYVGTNNNLPVFAQNDRHFVKLKNGIVVHFENENPTSLNIKDECLVNYGITRGE